MADLPPWLRLVSKSHWNKGVSRQRSQPALLSSIHEGAAHQGTPHLHHHLPREFVLEFQMMFAWTRLHTGLWNVTSVGVANSAKSMQPPPSVRNAMCVFVSLRKEIVSKISIWPRLKCHTCWYQRFKHKSVFVSKLFLKHVFQGYYIRLLLSFLQLQ